MIFDISDSEFMHIMQDPRFNLPVRWDGRDFENAVSNLLDEYINELCRFTKAYCPATSCYVRADIGSIQFVCDMLKQCIHEYHKGFPAAAFKTMAKVMNCLMETPLRVYQKSGDLEPLEQDRLYLFRLRGINDAAKHTRKDVFHVPACARSMISTCRYSIAGYPALYLTTSIGLGLEEIGNTAANILVSRFKIMRPQRRLNIRVLELGIRPQDFYEENREYNDRDLPVKDLRGIDLRNHHIRSCYLQWYPLIAACSFIRANKNTPFSSEYIIPQLLMQWVRRQIRRHELMGIRYFSCASIRAADLGLDYVFPVHNTSYQEGYCSILRDSFSLTNPVYLRDYSTTDQCEKYLISCAGADFDKI